MRHRHNVPKPVRDWLKVVACGCDFRQTAINFGVESSVVDRVLTKGLYDWYIQWKHPRVLENRVYANYAEDRLAFKEGREVVATRPAWRKPEIVLDEEDNKALDVFFEEE